MPIILVLALALLPIPSPVAAEVADSGYSGSARCAQCHEKEYRLWRGSHHDLAMAEATPETVLGDFSGVEFSAHGVTSRFFMNDGKFMVHTDGPDGKAGDFPIRYTFGWTPLQQYLVAFPGGRLQALGLAWDSRPESQGGQRWFHLYPEEQAMDYRHPLHWTSREQTWNYQCAECHSTGLRKGYDPAADTYDTTWQEIDVACESCHGPGARHIALAESGASAKGEDTDTGLAVKLAGAATASWGIDPKTGNPRRSEPRKDHTEIETCARCHSRRGSIWPDYQPGEPLHQTHRLALLDQQLYYPDGQIKDEVYVYGSFLQSAMYRAGVSCSDCHEPHSLHLRAEGNALCTRCHQSGRYDGEQHHHHGQGSAGSNCTSCHMPQRTYMGVDQRADHSLRVPRPDLSLTLGTPNACEQCHADKGNQWATAKLEEWFPDSTNRGPHFGQTLYAAQNGKADAGDRLLALATDPGQPGIARATAVDLLRGHAQPGYLFTLPRLIQDPDPLLRREALRLLEQADVRTQVDQGWPLLADPSRTVRLEAAQLLAPLVRQRLPERYRKQLDKGIDEYIRAQMTNAERPESRLNLGLVYASMGRIEEAEEQYRRAMALDPQFVPAYANLADIYRQAGRDEEGVAVLKQGIALVPGDASLHHALGLTLVRSDQPEAAMVELSRAAELAPEQVRYSYVYAVALSSYGHHSEALSVLGQALKRHPDDRDLLLTLVTLNREHGDPAAAHRYLTRFRQRYPDDPRGQTLEKELPSSSGD